MYRYNQWAGNPKGRPENKERCIVDVWETGRGMLSYQCKRKRGFGKDGLYCKQHARIYPDGCYHHNQHDQGVSNETDLQIPG